VFRSTKNLYNDTKLGWDPMTFKNDLSQGAQVTLRVNFEPHGLGYRFIGVSSV